MEGFTYNGVHCSTFSVYYVPDAGDKWFDDPEFEISKKEVSWKNGGYVYGTYAKIRTITLKCYFEEISIATREKIRRWLGRNTSGMLILDNMPFVYFNVRPSDIVTGKIYLDKDGTYSGTFSIKFMAEDPFGYLTRKSNQWTENDHAEDYCGIIAYNLMPAPPTTSSTYFDVYNPGTEACGLSLKLSGSCSNPIRFYNERNGTRCVISSFPSNSLYLDINGDTGNCVVYLNSPDVNASNGFAYHDFGIVRLEPCRKIISQSFLCGSKNLINPSTKVASITPGKQYVFSAFLKEDRYNTAFSISYVLNNDGNGPSAAFVRRHVGDRIKMVFNSMASTSVTFSYSDDILENVQIEEGEEPTAYMPYAFNSNQFPIVLKDVVVSESMVGAKIALNASTAGGSASIIQIDKENNAIICNTTFSPSGNIYIYETNHIVIQEQNSLGSWVTPTSLSLSHISIDYNPRLL